MKVRRAVPMPADPIEAERAASRVRRLGRGWIRVRDRQGVYLRHLGLDDVLPGPERLWPERELPPIIRSPRLE